MKPPVRILLLLVMATMCGTCFSPGYMGTALAAAAQDAGTRSSRQDMLRERQKRFVLRSLDDLRSLQALVDKVSADLDKEIDAITPLEPSVREKDLRSLADIFDHIEDWLKEHQARFDDDMALLSSGQTALDDRWAQRYAGMAETFNLFARQLSDMARHFEKEGRRLAKIIDRRRQLQDTLIGLEDERTGLDRKPAARTDKERKNMDADRLRARSRVIQNELLTLPLLDEAVLKHYANVEERARSEADWMQAKSEEYRVLGDISQVIMAPRPGRSNAAEASLRRVRLVFDRIIAGMQKRVDDVDRKLSRLSPAGSLSEVQHSSELGDLYREQRQRYNDYIGRLKVQAGAMEAELSELLVR